MFVSFYEKNEADKVTVQFQAFAHNQFMMNYYCSYRAISMNHPNTYKFSRYNEVLGHFTVKSYLRSQA